MAADPHTTNSGPGSGLSAPEGASTPLAGVTRRREGFSGPQTGTQGISIMEEAVKPYRVLVTGSRDWSDRRAIEDTLTTAGALAVALGQRLVVVHGACPTGADRIADAWARWHQNRGRNFDIEEHPARDFGPWPACGPLRNKHMVDLGADACFAFIGPCTSPRCRRPGPHLSHGASGCADLAEAAGIPVRRFTA